MYQHLEMFGGRGISIWDSAYVTNIKTNVITFYRKVEKSLTAQRPYLPDDSTTANGAVPYLPVDSTIAISVVLLRACYSTIANGVVLLLVCRKHYR